MDARHAAQRVSLTIAMVIAAFLGLTLLSTPAADASTSTVNAENDFVALVNVERARQGLHAVTVKTDIVRVARSHSSRMANQTHLHHNPNFSTQITGWQRVSENVGRGPSVEAIHRALMNSEGHRRNILDDRVTEIGVGVVIRNGQVWVTQNFRRPLRNVQHAPPSLTSFGDVASTNVHARAITGVADRGIASACGNSRFCPTTSVTRGEFAAMLARAMGLRPSTSRQFDDVSGPDAPYIEALADAGITSGVAHRSFAPDRRLTREQLGSFFARSLALSPQRSPFRDVSSAHDGNVGALHARGIVSGYSSTRYGARDPVTRAQTASMLMREFG